MQCIKCRKYNPKTIKGDLTTIMNDGSWKKAGTVYICNEIIEKSFLGIKYTIRCGGKVITKNEDQLNLF